MFLPDMVHKDFQKVKG